MNVMIAGGGTGGHIYIGIAVARELERRDSGYRFVFVGAPRGLESKIVPREGYPLELIDSAGLKGMGLAAQLRNMLRIPGSIAQARRLIRKHDPHVVIGVGGYSSGPVVVGAWCLGKPTLIIEPNAWPGLTNRWLSRIASAAAVAMPEAASPFRGRARVTGIPVRPEFRAVPVREHRGAVCLLVYGGSQGSSALNRIVCGALEDLKSLEGRLQVIHQTGEKEFDAVAGAYGRAGIPADVRPYLPRIFEEFARADLVLSRAGAGSIAELTTAGKAAILVPFPHSADDHQTRNARALEAAGAALHTPEARWEPGRLARELRRFMEHPEELVRMEEAARRYARPDAAARIADMAEELARRNPVLQGGRAV